MIDTKVCPKCGLEKPRIEFSRHESRYVGKCRECMHKKRKPADPNTPFMKYGKKYRIKHDVGLAVTSDDCCTILKKHHDALKDDPERLTSDFIKKLSKCKCDINTAKEIPQSI